VAGRTHRARAARRPAAAERRVGAAVTARLLDETFPGIPRWGRPAPLELDGLLALLPRPVALTTAVGGSDGDTRPAGYSRWGRTGWVAPSR
jgi:hypothetical protein